MMAAIDILPTIRSRGAVATRSSRRLGRAALFMIDALQGARVAPECARGRQERISWIAANLCALHALDVRTFGPQPPKGPCLFVANHLGYLDPTAILAMCPAIPLAKTELARWPFIGELARAYGVLFVDRSSVFSGARVLRGAMRTLAEGASVLAFPEGTTTTGSVVLPFRRGLFGAARRARAQIVPLAVRYDTPESCWVGGETFLPHYLRTTARARTRVELRFGDPIAPEGAATDLAQLAHQRVRDMLGS